MLIKFVTRHIHSVSQQEVPYEHWMAGLLALYNVIIY